MPSNRGCAGLNPSSGAAAEFFGDVQSSGAVAAFSWDVRTSGLGCTAAASSQQRGFGDPGLSPLLDRAGSVRASSRLEVKDGDTAGRTHGGAPGAQRARAPQGRATARAPRPR